MATANDGPLEIIYDKKDGLLFNRTIDDLVEKIELIYKDIKFKNKLSINGYKKVRNMPNKGVQMKKMYEVIYES